MPVAGVFDMQSAKVLVTAEDGHETEKTIIGHQRHIAVDTDSRPFTIKLMSLNVAD